MISITFLIAALAIPLLVTGLILVLVSDDRSRQGLVSVVGQGVGVKGFFV